MEDPKIKHHEHCSDKSTLKIICGAFKIGKSENCEDAYFIQERSFGLADGVSGWNDFGFSSEEFAN
jgi:hypothetical protein